jgi:hypothetical protein
VEVLSIDGSLHVTLEPTGDGRLATIVTAAGRFSGADHYITIRDLVEPTAPSDEARDPAIEIGRETEMVSVSGSPGTLTSPGTA